MGTGGRGEDKLGGIARIFTPVAALIVDLRL